MMYFILLIPMFLLSQPIISHNIGYVVKFLDTKDFYQLRMTDIYANQELKFVDRIYDVTLCSTKSTFNANWKSFVEYYHILKRPMINSMSKIHLDNPEISLRILQNDPELVTEIILTNYVKPHIRNKFLYEDIFSYIDFSYCTRRPRYLERYKMSMLRNFLKHYLVSGNTVEQVSYLLDKMVHKRKIDLRLLNILYGLSNYDNHPNVFIAEINEIMDNMKTKSKIFMPKD
jgi:hypothetical protein